MTVHLIDTSEVRVFVDGVELKPHVYSERSATITMTMQMPTAWTARDVRARKRWRQAINELCGATP